MPQPVTSPANHTHDGDARILDKSAKRILSDGAAELADVAENLDAPALLSEACVMGELIVRQHCLEIDRSAGWALEVEGPFLLLFT